MCIRDQLYSARCRGCLAGSRKSDFSYHWGSLDCSCSERSAPRLRSTFRAPASVVRSLAGERDDQEAHDLDETVTPNEEAPPRASRWNLLEQLRRRPDADARQAGCESRAARQGLLDARRPRSDGVPAELLRRVSLRQ